jgi:hypothetical protein
MIGRIRLRPPVEEAGDDEEQLQGEFQGGSSCVAPGPASRYLNPCVTIFRLRNVICVASGRFFGQTSWQPSSDMQPKTPSSSPINSK